MDASGGATLYGYTGKRLTTITDPNGNVTTYGYDGAGRLATTSFPDGGQETYTYWNDGLLRQKTDRRGTTVTYTYDAFKRLVTKSYSTGGTVTYAYEGQKLQSVTDNTVTPGETHTFGYDTRYRLSSAAQAGRGTLAYTYTADDRVETLSLSSGPTATYAYHPDGSLHTLQWSPVPGAFTWDYTARGQYDTLAFPNGQLRDYGYDDQGRLTSLTNVLGASTIASYAYGYDVDPQTGQPSLLGQRTSQTATLPAQGLAGAVTRYGYDPLYQLTRAEYPSAAPFNSEVHTWSYDSIGNRTTQGIGASVQTYTYLKSQGSPLNGQRLAGDGVDAMTYDPAGNLATRQSPGGNFIFGYDPENRLKTITGAETATYTYDYQGRRTSKTVGGVTTTYLYDGLNLVSETTSGQTTYFLNGPGIDEPLAMSKSGAISYFDVDGLGSVVATNDPSGAVTHSVVFDAWGNVKAETGTRTHPFTYTGRERGEAGFHFYRARFYQPSIGRFSQEDPIRSFRSHYAYVENSPIRFSDSLGLAAESACFCSGGSPKRGLESAKACCETSAPMPPDKNPPYGTTETYGFVFNANFVYMYGGDNPWGNLVRGCLSCMHEHGASQHESHLFCYMRATALVPPNWALEGLAHATAAAAGSVPYQGGTTIGGALGTWLGPKVGPYAPFGGRGR